MTTDELERVRDILLRGLRPDEHDEARILVGASEEVSDALLAKGVMHRLAETQLGALSLGAAVQVPHNDGAERPSVTDASFLGRLTTTATDPGTDVASLTNVETVRAVALAGTLPQRRAAVLRLAKLALEAGKREARDAAQFLGSLRDVELSYELASARSRLAGAPGKAARIEREQVHRRSQKLQRSIRAFWDGRLDKEPLKSLLSEERAFLFVRLRSVPDEVVAHVGARLEALRGRDPDKLLDLLTSLRYCGDPRLTTRLVTLLDDRNEAVAAEAARILASIEDPRALAALQTAFDRSVDVHHRLVLAGALLVHQDASGVEDLKEGLEKGEPEVLRLSLEGLSGLPTVDDSEQIRTLAGHEDARVQRQAIRTLGRVGASQALRWLRKHGPNVASGAMTAELEEAERSVAARLELLGEEPPADPLVPLTSRSKPLERKPETPLLRRLLARWYYVSGWCLWLVGAQEAAAYRFERASKRYPRWVSPHLAVGMVRARRKEHGHALASFRRALDVNRGGVERRPRTMRLLTTAFLRRAAELEESGRADIARGLLEEVLSIDLRNAPTASRFELQRRHEAQRRRTARLEATGDP